MKKYKHNITIPFIYFMTNIMLFSTPVLLLMWTFINKTRVIEALLVFPYMLLTILTIYFIAFLVNLVYKLCSKDVLTLTDEKIIAFGKEIKYEFVDKIVFDKGLKISTTDKDAPKGAGLTLYNNDTVLLYIKNPNILALHKIIKHCKGAKLELFNKKLAIALGIISGISLIIWLIMLIISL